MLLDKLSVQDVNVTRMAIIVIMHVCLNLMLEFLVFKLSKDGLLSILLDKLAIILITTITSLQMNLVSPPKIVGSSFGP